MLPFSSSRTSGLCCRALTRQYSPTFNVIPAATRAASLSAIHRGLRRSEKAQYGEARGSLPPARSRRSGSDHGDRTLRALEGAGSKRQRQKLMSKLKRKEDEENGTGKQTRRKRFVDPSNDFGKTSLVWQLKYGSLKELPKTIDPPVSARSFREKRREDQSLRDTARRPSSFEHRESNLGAERYADNAKSERRTTSPRRREEDEDGVSTPAPRQRKGNMMPMTIKYTTAASQFLYGKAVVLSALQQARRKMYNLYIYGGENRSDSKDNLIISSLAKEKGVPITIVPNEDQRLMDKMSLGRPHNGFVLETSPLPLKPVTSLGKLEETPGKLGFHVSLDYQTKEEEAINGADTLILRSSNITPRPFVLLLNEILDPGNLGAILRTASYLGADAVGITNRKSSNLTPVVLKSAAGSVEEITIFTVDSPEKFLEESRRAGWKSYAAVAAPDKKLTKMHAGKFVSTEEIEQQSPLSTDPCILVLGNEGYGLSKKLKVAADYELSVPRFVTGGCVDSLNVSVAAGLLCHAFVKEPWATRASQPLQRGNDASSIGRSTNESTSFENKFRGQVRTDEKGGGSMF